GLLGPQRAGGARVFDYRDRARLLLILKFRRLGFSLDEIHDYLSRYGAGQGGSGQFLDGLVKIRSRVAALTRMRVEIDETLIELAEMEADALARLTAE
ncbi:MerR family DNA-binding protein, partial [bacterium]|nr:MerR family DNA-binding protein [bacterium]